MNKDVCIFNLVKAYHFLLAVKSHCIPAQKFMFVSVDLNHNRSP